MVQAEPLHPGIPGTGFQLVLDSGEVCEVTKKPRQTVIKFPCAIDIGVDIATLSPLRAYEGEKKLICNYFVDFPPSELGCPVHSVSTVGHGESGSTTKLLAGEFMYSSLCMCVSEFEEFETLNHVV